MLNISLIQFIVMISGIAAGTLVIAAVWAGLETVFPKLKGYLARV